MKNVLIGGFITLAGTCLVQILVIPWVQARSRRRERWEKDVGDLLRLIECTLPRAVRRLDLAALEPWSAVETKRAFDEDEDPDDEGFREAIDRGREKAEEAFKELLSVWEQIFDLYRRVCSAGKHRAAWPPLVDSVTALNGAIWKAHPSRWQSEPDLEGDVWCADIDAVHDEADVLSVRFEEVAEAIHMRAGAVKIPAVRKREPVKAVPRSSAESSEPCPGPSA
jgi:hypothetical protein